jgi:hypothetical protein
MKPVCVKCHRFFKCTKTGFYFAEGMPKEPGAKPGLVEPDKWEPYKVWSGDKWECPGCGAVILSGFGSSAIAEHFEGDFKKWLERSGKFQVNDC